MPRPPQRASASQGRPSSGPLPIELTGARLHNLQGIDLTLQAGEVIAITGVSGAGKSSLALDTLYAEGQRRYVESFSPYARQFLERLERPPVDRLEPVPAGIAVDRRAPVKSSRSTVATLADLAAYLSALFTREAVPYCPEHGVPALHSTPRVGSERVLASRGGQRAVISYPVELSDREGYLALRERLDAGGWRRLWSRGKLQELDAVRPSDALKYGVEVVVDRVQLRAEEQPRLMESVERAWRDAGVAHVHTEGARPVVLREGLACPECGLGFAAPRPGLFSYESPLGVCAECRGFGRTIGVDLAKVIPEETRTLAQYAIRPWSGKSTTWERRELRKLCERHGIPMDRPWRELPERARQLVLEGDGAFEDGQFPGVLGWFRWLETRTYKMHVRVLLARYRSYDPCAACGGKRFNALALSYRVDGLDLAQWHALEVREAHARVAALKPATGQGELARQELESRLRYLERVGLGYLTLDRQGRSLSGGEAQRLTLTAALGTTLHSALFVLDEPSVGLHATDVPPLREMLDELASRGNVVLVVEHERQLISGAARVVELGPGAGQQGGRVSFDGPPAALAGARGPTARALHGVAASRRERRRPRAWLELEDVSAHNLRHVDVRVPLGVLATITGPSGSGKSSLAVAVLYRALARRFGAKDVEPPEPFGALRGAEALRSVTLVDQTPLGRTSRGNTATYTKAWDLLRARLAREPEAARLGLTPSSFSFNVAGGRCEACKGEGVETVEMQFLADVKLTCPVCRGQRFRDEVLRVRFQGRNVAEWLGTTVDDALALAAEEVALARALGPAQRLGLGYLTLGQPLSTLSGGEAQRVKLARALTERHERALFILDEPSAGLHTDEIKSVLSAVDVILAGGGSVLMVEHDLELIAAADYVVDLGPGAGSEGGRLVAVGTPEQIAARPGRTGAVLAKQLRRRPRRAPRRGARRPRLAPAAAELRVVRAREHNLRELSARVPHGQLTIVTGPSGSGKSTLAFDVVFAEGQRRFLETLSPYARQFLPTLPRPDVDAVTGVPPSIALEQRTTRGGARSTVATVTEVAHYLRLLYAKLGVAHCPTHGLPVSRRTPAELLEELRQLRGKGALLAPAVRARKGVYLDLFTAASRAGIEAAWCDGALVSTEPPPRLSRQVEHSVDLVMATEQRWAALSSSVLERALVWGEGVVKLRSERGDVTLHSTVAACPSCGFSVPELDPRWFSFSTEQGRCERCEGQGVVPAPARRGRRGKPQPEAEPQLVPCPECEGARLAPIPRAVEVEGMSYAAYTALDVAAALERLEGWRFSAQQRPIAAPIVRELERRLRFLVDVGLDYLSLARAARTLSGGELQRLRLAAQLGAGLSGALYVLDEPTIGLHPRDTRRLLGNLRRLVALGSTVLVVEHDLDTILAADHLIDLGPAGGVNGGQVMAEGPPAQVLASPLSPTGRALAHPAPLRAPRATGSSVPWLGLEGARANNLRSVDLRLALGRFNVVAGVSGSGKSSLVRGVLLPALREALGLVTPAPGPFTALTGHQHLRRALAVDQSPIGRTPRSVPATFLGLWDTLRALYAETPEARAAGFGPARFSFNSTRGGRCPVCEGQGVITHEMSFLPDVTTVCTACDGQRFEPRTLEVRWLGLSAGQLLELSAQEAAELLVAHPRLAEPLRTLVDLGAGYVRLGQGSHTLSGGEAQRLKLASELTATARHEPTLYVLDEPTTGLHVADVEKLMGVLERLVARGDTLVVIEHHPLVIAGADHVVELGPEGGRGGGEVIASGSPSEVARAMTPTAEVIREELARLKAAGRAPRRLR